MIHDNAHDHPEQQLQQTATRLQVALGYTADQVSALPSPALKIQELEQENARLQRENEELRRLLELYSRTNVTYRITLDQNRTWWSSYPGSDEPSEIGIDFDFQDSSWRRAWFVKEVHRFNKCRDYNYLMLQLATIWIETDIVQGKYTKYQLSNNYLLIL